MVMLVHLLFLKLEFLKRTLYGGQSGASEDLHETFARLQKKVVTVQDNPNTLWMIELSRKEESTVKK